MAPSPPLDPNRGPRPMLWAGRILTALVASFLLMDGVGKLLRPAPVVEATVGLGYPERSIVGLGIVVTACVALYLAPPTAPLGAILLTGYLGGAVAAHVRVGAGWFPTLFPVALGLMAWGGLVLRDAPLRAYLRGRPGA